MRKLTSLVFVTFLLIFAHLIAFAQVEGACPGFESRLTMGMPARVTAGAANNVRIYAGLSFAVNGQIPGGTAFTVRSGPICADNITWWEINNEEFGGWTAEGSGDAYFLEPISEAELEASRPPRGENMLPEDVVTGLAVGQFGAGPHDYGTCPDLYETNPSLFFDDYGGLAGLTHHYMEGGGFIYASGSTVDATYTTQYRYMPAICAGGRVNPSDAAAYAPDGTFYDPEIYVMDDVISQVTIPFYGYAQTGVWTLQVYDFVFYVNVLPVSEPTVFNNAVLLGDTTTFVLAGYTPNDVVKVVSYQGETIDVQLDTNGYGFGVFSDPTITTLAVVPRSHRNISYFIKDVQGGDDVFGVTGIWVGGFELRYAIPPEYSEDLLYELLWNAIPFDVEGWTCPGGLSIRLTQETTAHAVVPEVQIHSAPSFSANVIGTFPRGGSVLLDKGVACADGGVWWRTDDGGWVVESANGAYLLEPA